MQDIQFPANLLGSELTFTTTWGLFSPERIDDGSALLLKYLGDTPEDANVLDLGCGYGALGIPIAKQLPQGHVTMVDTNFVAVEYANKNIQLNNLSNAEALLSNGLQHLPKDETYDLIVSNLPAKIGRELTQRFLDDAKARLNPGGRVVVVVVKGLKDFIKRSFKDTFGDYKKLKQGPTHAVFQNRV